MSDQKNNQRGSALIATLIIISALGLFVATSSHQTLVEVASTSSFEDSTMAFAAAEAGIEEGLLRFRFDHNLEMPLQPAGSDMSQATHQAFVSNMTQKTLVASAPQGTTAQVKAATDSAYELRAWYKDTKATGKLYKDQTLDLDISNLTLTSATLNLVYTIGQDSSPVTANNVLIQATLIAQDASGNQTETCALGGTSSNDCKVSIVGGIGQNTVVISLPNTNGFTAEHLRLKPLIRVGAASAPADSYISYTLTPTALSGATRLIDTGITTIESTGYFGAARRTLVAKVDRDTGRLLGVFDYALYSGDVTKDLVGPTP